MARSVDWLLLQPMFLQEIQREEEATRKLYTIIIGTEVCSGGHSFLLSSVTTKTMALPQNMSVSPFKTQETDYGNEQGMIRRAPATSSVHPLEASENSFYKRQEELRMTSLTKAYGLGFVMHLKHERAAAGCREIGHLGFLPRSNAHIDALTGHDLDIDFGDTLGIEPEVSRNPHQLMEKLQQTPRFRF